LNELKSGSRRQVTGEKSEKSACLTPGFSPGKQQNPEPTGFSRKAGRSQTGGASGLLPTPDYNKLLLPFGLKPPLLSAPDTLRLRPGGINRN